MVLRCFHQGVGDDLGFSATVDGEAEGSTYGLGPENKIELGSIFDGAAIDGCDDIVHSEPGPESGAVSCEFNDDGALGGGGANEAGDTWSEILHLEIHNAAADPAMLEDLFNNGPDAVDRNGESDACGTARTGDDEGVESDDLSATVNKGAAGVTWVDGGVGLNHVVEGFLHLSCGTKGSA